MDSSAKSHVAGPAHKNPNPAAIKEMLLEWCKAKCAGYEVNIFMHMSSFSTIYRVGQLK